MNDPEQLSTLNYQLATLNYQTKRLAANSQQLTTYNMDLPTASPGYFVYILSNEARTAFYISSTGFLSRKLAKHAKGQGYEYGNGNMSSCKDLIYYESYEAAKDALERGERIRQWNPARVTELVTARNPDLRSLNHEVVKKNTSLL